MAGCSACSGGCPKSVFAGLWARAILRSPLGRAALRMCGRNRGPRSSKAATNAGDGFSTDTDRPLCSAARMIWMHGSVSVSTSDASICMAPAPACWRSRIVSRKRSAAARSSTVGNFNRDYVCLVLHIMARSPLLDRSRHAALVAVAARRAIASTCTGVENRVGHMSERMLAHHRTALESRARHAVDQRRIPRPVRALRRRTPQFQHPLGAVLTHAGQNRRRPPTCRSDARGRAEQDVDRGPMAADRGAVRQAANVRLPCRAISR